MLFYRDETKHSKILGDQNSSKIIVPSEFPNIQHDVTYLSLLNREKSSLAERISSSIVQEDEKRMLSVVTELCEGKHAKTSSSYSDTDSENLKEVN